MKNLESNGLRLTRSQMQTVLGGGSLELGYSSGGGGGAGSSCTASCGGGESVTCSGRDCEAQDNVGCWTSDNGGHVCFV